MESGGRQPGDPIRIGLHQLFPEQRVHQRAIPRGVPGIAMFAIGGAVLLVGHWIAVQSYKKRLARKEEEYISRVNLLPLLQSENDRRYLRARRAMLAEEQRVAAQIPGWVVGGTVYNTRWMPPDYDREGNW